MTGHSTFISAAVIMYHDKKPQGGENLHVAYKSRQIHHQREAKSRIHIAHHTLFTVKGERENTSTLLVCLHQLSSVLPSSGPMPWEWCCIQNNGLHLLAPDSNPDNPLQTLPQANVIDIVPQLGLSQHNDAWTNSTSILPGRRSRIKAHVGVL